MKQNAIYLLGIVIAILALVLSGCSAPNATSTAVNQAVNDTTAAQTTSDSGQTDESISNDQQNELEDEDAEEADGTSESEGVITEETAYVSAGSVSQVMTPSSGALQIRVTDAPAKEEITGIQVTVSEIMIHKAATEEEQEQEQGDQENENENQNADNGDWMNIDVDPDNNTFDLLVVKDDPQTLALVFPEVGTYTQIRMVVDSVMITFGEGDDEHTEEATVPSGTIKFVHPFEITSTDTVDLLFDFDAAKSVNVAGNGKVTFKPVIKLSVSKAKDIDEEEDEDENEADEEEENEEIEASEAGNFKAITISTDELPDGIAGKEYGKNGKGVDLKARYGDEPYTWSAVIEDLPEGLELNAETGVLSGIPVEAGEFTFEITVTDINGESYAQSYTIEIEEPED